MAAPSLAPLSSPDAPSASHRRVVSAPSSPVAGALSKSVVRLTLAGGTAGRQMAEAPAALGAERKDSAAAAVKAVHTAVQPVSAAPQPGPVEDRPVKVFVGQIPKDWPASKICELFENHGIKLIDAKVIINQVTLLSQGCAFVTIASQEEANSAISRLHNKLQTAPGKWLQVRLAFKETGRLFCTGIGSADEPVLCKLFSQYGAVASAHIVRNAKGESKGCAIVEFETKEEALKAIEGLDDTPVFPNSLTRMHVSWARTANFSKDSSGAPTGGPGVAPGVSSSPGRMRPPMVHLGGWDKSSAPSPRTSDLYSPAQHVYNYFFPTDPSLSPHGSVSTGGGGGPLSPTQSQGAPGYYYTTQPDMQTLFYPMSPTVHHVPGGYMGAPLSPTMYTAGPGNMVGGAAAAGAAVGAPGPVPPYYVQPSPVFSPLMQERRLPMSPKRFAEGPPGANLFISGFTREFTEDDMYELFARYGTLLSWMIYMDKITQRSKCFGFVSYTTVEAADKAREALNKAKIGNFILYVSTKQGRGGFDSPRESNLGAYRKTPADPPSHFKLEDE